MSMEQIKQPLSKADILRKDCYLISCLMKSCFQA